MKALMSAAALLLAAGLAPGDAHAWATANRMGGSTTHSYGATTHANRWGGSSSFAAGEGASHSNVYGAGTAHAYGGGTEHTNAYGGSTYGRYGSGAYHSYPSGATAYHPAGVPAYPTYPAYHPPVAVAYTSSTCSGCAAAAGALVGVTAGAAIASANTAAMAGAAPASGSYMLGMSYALLPNGASALNLAGATYYVSNNVWFQPAYGANGVYYRVVPKP
jgi:hypothetical protein